MLEQYFGPVGLWEQDDRLSRYTAEQKAVSEYTGLTFIEVDDLNFAEYRLYLRDGWLYGLSQSEKGRELLNTISRLARTAPDERAVQGFEQMRKEG